MTPQAFSGREPAGRPGLPQPAPYPALAGDERLRVDEYAEEHRYVVRLTLPGIKPDKDLDVSIDAHVLTIRGEHPAVPAATGMREPDSRTFCVRITLPARTDDTEVAAIYRNGVLEVSAGWQERPTARTIKVLTLSDPG